MSRPFAMKYITPAQGIAGKLAVLLAGAAFICTLQWATSTNKTDKFLGGLDWDRHVINWHIVCMVGFMCSFSLALISFRLLPLGKPMNKALHVFFQTLALFCLIVGLAAVFKSHNTEKYGYKANLYSMHSWIGIGAVVLFGQNYLLGAVHFLTEKMPLEMKKLYMPYHVFLGELAYLTAFAAIETGLMEKVTFMDCGYDVTEPDYNPAEHYLDIPAGCRLGQGIGVIVFFLLFSTYLVLKNWPSAQESEKARKVERDPLLA